MREKPDSGTKQRQAIDAEEVAEGATARRIELSVPQVAGSVLATVAAAVLASQLGVYGTILGAGVVSVVATCGGPVLQHLFSRTGEQLREAAVPGRAGRGAADPGAAPAGEGPPVEGEFGAPSTYGTRMRGWKRPLAAAAVVFGVAMAAVTVYEVAAGQDLAGRDGTTVGSVLRGGGGGGTGGGTGDTDDGPRTTPSDRSSPDGTGENGGGDGTTGGEGSGDRPGTGEDTPGAGEGTEGTDDGTTPGGGSADPRPDPSPTTPPSTPSPQPTPSSGGDATPGTGVPAPGASPAPTP